MQRRIGIRCPASLLACVFRAYIGECIGFAVLHNMEGPLLHSLARYRLEVSVLLSSVSQPSNVQDMKNAQHACMEQTRW